MVEAASTCKVFGEEALGGSAKVDTKAATVTKKSEAPIIVRGTSYGSFGGSHYVTPNR